MTGRSILLPQHKPGDPSLAYTTEQLKRKVANSRMSTFRSIPTKRQAWHVTLTKLQMPEWALRVFSIPSLPSDKQSFWVRRRKAAAQLVQEDHVAGGAGHTECYQWRLCCVCKRVLVGAAAHDYQEKMRRPKAKWEFQQGPSCGVECEPEDISRRRRV
jgi:hypothetical protein